MKAFLSGMPAGRDWFFGVRTFAASMIALYIALWMQLPRPYWAMATVYIVSSPFVGPTSSKALYRTCGTLLGAAAAVCFVPLFSQVPPLLSVVVALWTGTMLFLSMQLRTANSYALMLAGYTLPLIALPTVSDPLSVFDVASSRTLEIVLGIVCAAVVGSLIWPRRLEPVVMDSVGKWFGDAREYSRRFLDRDAAPEAVGALRGAMVASFNALEPMLGQLSHEGSHPQTIRNAKDLRGRMIHLLPTVDALDDALTALEKRAPTLAERLLPLQQRAAGWAAADPDDFSSNEWAYLRQAIADHQAENSALSGRHEALLSNALYRLGEWVDLWQDCRTLQHLIRTGDHGAWRATYRHWRLRRLKPYFDRGMMLYSVLATATGICVASALWVLLGWTDGASAVILAAVSCSFFAAMDDPAPQIYRFFFWTTLSVVFAGLYLFWILPQLHDFPMLVLAFAVPFIWVGTLTVQPRYYLATLLTIVNTASFISITEVYNADFLTFVNGNLGGPIGLLFAFVWTLITRPFGAELAVRRMTRSSWRDIVSLSEPASLAQHRRMGVRMLDRLMQQLPRLAQTGQDSGIALRELRVALNLLDLIAQQSRLSPAVAARQAQVVEEVGRYFRDCLDARERLPAPAGLLKTLDRARRSLTSGEPNQDAALQTLHALSGLRLALLPGVEIVSEAGEEELPHGLDGAPL